MKKCKITVLKRNFDEELAREYGVEGVENSLNMQYSAILNWLNIENAGIINAIGIESVEQLKMTKYPNQAYELGKSL